MVRSSSFLLCASVLTACTKPDLGAGRPRAFRLSSVDVHIVDLGMTRPLSGVLGSVDAPNGVFTVNGGFFDPQGQPVGLAISGRVVLSPLQRDLSGGVLFIRDGVATLTAAEDYREEDVEFAIQCRPRLVVDSRTNIRSDDGRRAARAALCIREHGHVLELVVRDAAAGSEGPTLFELASELLASGCEQALNLDGGPSVGWSELSGGATVSMDPRTPIRHAIVVERK